MSLEEQLETEIKELESDVRQERSDEPTEGSQVEPVGQAEEPGDGQGRNAAGHDGRDDERVGSEDGQETNRHEQREQVLDPEKRIEQLEKALNESRAKQRIANREASELRALRERVDELGAKVQPQAQDEKPDRDKNPLEYLDWLDRQVESYRSEQKQRAEAERQQEAYNQQVEALQNYGRQAENEYRAIKPDYDKAFEHYTQGRVNMIKAMGATEPMAAQAVQNELLQLVSAHAQQGSNPAEAIYGAAQAMGYVPGNPQRRSTPTMPNGGKPPKQNNISIDAMATADPEEFDKMWAKAEKAGLFNT